VISTAIRPLPAADALRRAAAAWLRDRPDLTYTRATAGGAQSRTSTSRRG
jgi:hypothetical protein